MFFACCCQKAVHDTFEGEQLMFREIICSIFVNVFSEQVALVLFSFSDYLCFFVETSKLQENCMLVMVNDGSQKLSNVNDFSVSSLFYVK